MGRMDSKIILITGAAKGIGFEAAQQLAGRGHTVLAAARNVERGEAAVQKMPGDARFLHLDVTSADSISGAVEEVTDSMGKLDVLVNNAAILLDHHTKPADVTPETVEQTLATNVTAVHAMIRAFLPLLKKSEHGASITNLSSGAGQLTRMFNQVWAPAYQISKAGLNAVTRIWATELQEDGIPVNSVCPGWCRTEMGGANADRSPDEGTAGIIRLATEADPSITGRFFRDEMEMDW
jgi:NAD(P)-dependent dehydrogenase (short-subunit alcohol dehydrogenase family)